MIGLDLHGARAAAGSCLARTHGRMEAMEVERSSEEGLIVQPAAHRAAWFPEVHPAEAQAASPVLGGELGLLELSDLLRVLVRSERPARLLVHGPGKAGEITIGDGVVLHAALGTTEGRTALFELLRIRDGRFRVETDVASSTVTIDADLESLLMAMAREAKGLA